jgi:hypothetical protein
MHHPSSRVSFSHLSHGPLVALVLAGAATFMPACAGVDPTVTEALTDGADGADGTATPGSPVALAALPAPAGAASTNLFHVAEPWTKDVEALAPSASSAAIIGWLGDHGGWGTHKLHLELGLKVLHATGSVPFQTFTPTEDFYTPDCDHVPFPLPPGGALEEEDGYACTTDGDCHLLVVHEPSHKLYEMWRANVSGGAFRGGCAAVWDLDKAYPAGRGESCTSADAGGFPIAAMVFTADEVARGSIDHALRFILPNSRIRRGVYVHPATHASDALHGGPDAPPYGVRFRLRKDFPMAQLPSDGARVVARALQRYGMLLADGGQVPLTAADDRFTEHKWAEVGVDEDALTAIAVSDMEVVDLGEPITATGDCVRN